MADILELEVKSNIGTVTKDTKDYKKSLEQVNEEIDLQNKFIIAQEKELIKLKAQQDSIAKGAWVAGMDKLNDKIKLTTKELKLEKNALKGLKQEQKEAVSAVKKFTQAQTESNKASEGSVGAMSLMGVSINGLKSSFSKVIPTIKAMFGSVKAGLISTGIGAFVVIVGSLFAFFTKTKRGAEMLEVAMAAVGVIMKQIEKVFAISGEAMVKAFEDPQQAVEDLWELMKELLINRMEGFVNIFSSQMKIVEAALNLDWDMAKEGALEYGQALIQMSTGLDAEMQQDIADGVKDFVDETKKAVDVSNRLTAAQQRLRDEERKFNKVRAQTRQEIEKARLDALDESKTSEERLAALKKANDLELETTAKTIEMQEKKIALQKTEMRFSDDMAADLDALSTLETELIDLQTRSFKTQKKLARDMESLTNEIWDDKIAKNNAFNEESQRLLEEDAAAKKKAAEDEIALAETVEKSKSKVRDAGLKNISSGIKLAQSLAGDNKKLQAGLLIAESASGIAKTVIATQAANALVTAKYAAIPGGIALAAAEKTMNNIGAGIAIAANMAATKKGLSALGGGGAPSGANPGGGAGGGEGTPAPQMMSGSFDISGAEAPEPIKAFVLTDEMSNSQNQLANIRRRATI